MKTKKTNTNIFEESITSEYAKEQPNHRPAVERLRAFCLALNTKKFKDTKAECTIDLGYLNGTEQQYRLIVKVHGNHGYPEYTTVLFRVSVPLVGFPVSVECIGDNNFEDGFMVCKNTVELDTALLKNLRRKEFLALITAIETLARTSY